MSKPKLDVMGKAGAVGKPSYAGDTTTIIPNANPSQDQFKTDQTYSHENRSAQFKYPNTSQDVNPLDTAYLNNK